MQHEIPKHYTDWIDEHIARAQANPSIIRSDKLSLLWDFFKTCEQELVKTANKTLRNQVDDEKTEFGLTLYALNHLIEPRHKEFFQSLGLPAAAITPATWNVTDETSFAMATSGEGWLSKNGTLYVLDVPFSQLDPLWFIASTTYLFREMGVIKMHSFETQGTIVNDFEDKDQLVIAIIGDWGTGIWKDNKYPDPASLVADSIKQLPVQPDVVIHLGDVYYAGLEREEKRNFLPGFPKVKSGFHFTLNSNHESYDGANGYFDTALTSDLFIHQGNKSYFAITLKDWVIIGLDSSYYDKSLMVMKGALTDGSNCYQADFIKSLNISPDKKILLLTHHPGISYDGTEFNQPMMKQVYESLGNIFPDYWYYGHTHNSFVYNEHSVIGAAPSQTRFHTYPRLRCVGGSSIPFGMATIEPGNKGLDYYANEPLPDPDIKQQLRVLNGFAVITLEQSRIHEQFYAASPTTGPRVVWDSITG